MQYIGIEEISLYLIIIEKKYTVAALGLANTYHHSSMEHVCLLKI